LNKIKDYVQFQTHSDAALCQIFVMTLSGVARSWFEGLPAGSIDTFADLEARFRSRFSTAIPIKKSAATLFDIHRNPQESLKAFLTRFDAEMSLTADITVDFAVEALKRNCAYGKLRDTLMVDPPATLDALRQKAHNYARMEEEENRGKTLPPAQNPTQVNMPVSHEIYVPSAPNIQVADNYAQRKDHIPRAANRQRGNYSKGGATGQVTRQQGGSSKGRFEEPDLPSLILPRAEILVIAQERKLPIRYPPPVRPGTSLGKRENAYCKFHDARGHNTEWCRELKFAIARLLEEGYLGEFAVKAREE
jgi:hypothetical protein